MGNRLNVRALSLALCLSASAAVAAPVLSSILPSSGPTTGGTALTINGTAFGASPTVTLGSSACPVITATATQVQCLSPAGTGRNKPVVVYDSGQASNALLFNYDPPTVANVAPSSGPTSGGLSITLNGTNFGPAGAAVTIGGNACTSVIHGVQPDTEVRCTLPAGAGVSRAVQVTVDGQASSSPATFSYSAPTLATVTPSTGPTAGGTTLTLSGANFGAAGASVTLAGVTCPVTVQSHTQVLCTLPPGAGTARAVQLTLAGQSSNTQPFSYLGPTLASIAPLSGPTSGGATLTLTGSNFGPAGAAVTVGGVSCPLTSQTHTELLCTLPAGAGASQAVQVTVAGQASGTRTFSYNAPLLSSLMPSNGPTAGGAVLTLTGTNFGAAGATVTIGGVSCPLTSQSHTQLLCTLPPGAGASNAVQVTVAGQSSNTRTFSYDAPSLGQLSPTTGPTSGAVTLTLTGSNFGASGAVVSVGGATCPITQQSHTELRCTLPAGAGLNNPVDVSVAGQTSSPLSFNYAAPSLSALSPTTGPTNGGITLTLTGSNFGMAGALVTVGGAACPVMAQTHTQVECMLPPGTGLANTVRLGLAGQLSGSKTFDYAAPSLTALSPTTGPITGGVTLTLTGADFGASGASVTVGGTVCPVTQQSHEELRCTLPAGAGPNRPVLATTAGQRSNSLLFTYASSPPVATAQSATTPEDLAAQLTLAGTDVDGDALTFALVAQPAAGTGQVTLNGAVATYTPPANYAGATSFAFKANDGALDSAAATVSLTVTPVNDPPTALPQSATTAQATAVTVTLAGMDVDGDALTFAVSTPPIAAQGAVVLTGAQARFTPAAGFSGTATFAFTASDGQLTSAPATVSIVVGGAAHAPVASNASVELAEDGSKAVTLSATDADGDPLTFALTQQPPAGQGTVTLAGAIATYTPPANFHGATTFQFTANDGALTSSAATVSVTVTPVNDAPVAEGVSATTASGTPVTLTLQASDADGDTLTFRLVTEPPASEGAVSLAGASATFTPAAGFSGLSSFTFEAFDGQVAGSATAAVTVEPATPKPEGCSCTASLGVPGLALALLLALRRRRAT